MDKEIYNKIIEAEKLGENSILEVFNELFNNYRKDYKNMAQLMLVLKNRLDANLENDTLCELYINLTSDITERSNEELTPENLEQYCRIADEYCIDRDEYDGEN